MDFNNFINQLKVELQKPLPGVEAHELMSPMRVGNKIDIDKAPLPKGIKLASVVCLFLETADGINFVLMKRTESPYTHSAQISFPGGGMEKEETEMQAGLRELNEEIGINLNSENVIGKLTNIYIPVSNFKVYPFVAVLKKEANYVLDKHEVDYVFEVNIKDLLNENKVKNMQMKTKYGEYPINYFDFNNEIVWGATAVILSELKVILKNIFN